MLPKEYDSGSTVIDDSSSILFLRYFKVNGLAVGWTSWVCKVSAVPTVAIGVSIFRSLGMISSYCGCCSYCGYSTYHYTMQLFSSINKCLFNSASFLSKFVFNFNNSALYREIPFKIVRSNRHRCSHLIMTVCSVGHNNISLIHLLFIFHFLRIVIPMFMINGLRKRR